MTWYLRAFLPLIFFAQFGYLYSFQPSAFNKDLILDLVKNSSERNKKSATTIYESLKDDYVTYFTAKSMSFMRFNKKTHEVEKLLDSGDLRDKVVASLEKTAHA